MYLRISRWILMIYHLWNIETMKLNDIQTDISFQNSIRKPTSGWESWDGRCVIRNTHCKWSWRCPKRIRLKFKIDLHFITCSTKVPSYLFKSRLYHLMLLRVVYHKMYRTRIKTMIIDKNVKYCLSFNVKKNVYIKYHSFEVRRYDL